MAGMAGMARKVSSTEHHRGSHAEGRTVKHGVSRLLPYAPPWLLWLGLVLVAYTGWRVWGGSPWYSSAVVLSVLFNNWVIYKATSKLTELLRLLAMVSHTVMGMFVHTFGILGPTSVLMSLWAGVGFTLCVSWNIRRMLLTGALNGEQLAGTGGNVGRMLDKLNGAKVGTPKLLDGGVIEIPIEANRGEQTQDDLKQIVSATESVAGLRPGAGQLIKSKTDAGMATMRFIPVDQLEGMIPWPGPSHFGASVNMPVPVGLYADTDLCELCLTADETVGRNAAQWLIMGMTGAGKSKGMLMLLADLLTRKDVTLWAHDHVKGLQTLKPLLVGGGIDWVTMDVPSGKRLLDATRQVIQARARWLGARDYDNWEEGCGLNLLVVWLEEATDLAQLKVLLQLVKEGRSVGVIIMISLQRASHTAIDTDTRAQLSGNICFGVDSSTDASFGLPPYAIDAGAHPERWGATKPGSAYIAAPGIEETKAGTEMRFYFAEREAIIDAVKRGSVVRRPLEDEEDTLTIRAAGKAYETRIDSAVYMNPEHPDYARAMGMDIGSGKRKGTVDVAESVVVGRESRAVANSGNGGSVDIDDSGIDEDEADVDEDDEIVSTDEAEAAFASDIVIPPCPIPDYSPERSKTLRKMTTEECRQMVQHYLGRMYAEGKTEVSGPDIFAMTPPITRGREWVRAELHRLAGENVDEGADPEAVAVGDYTLHRDDDSRAGAFTIVPPRVV